MPNEELMDSRASSGSTGSAGWAGGTPRRRRVLIIDDDEGIREVLAALVAIEDCEARTAGDGDSALAVLRSWQPDLILLDVVMPGMDGPAFVLAYRETPGPHAPIVLLTGNEDRGDLVAELGVAGSLPKPFSVEALQQILDQFVDCK